jgi:hypothetical protein
MQALELFKALLGKSIPEKHLGESGDPVDCVTRDMFYFWK